MIDLRILGPLDVSTGGHRVPIGGRRGQVILAVLALEANRTVPVERLIEAVWEDRPPVTARSQVQICVSGLRRALAAAEAPDMIETCAPGYLLRIPPDRLDAELFDALVAHARTLEAQNRHAEAASELRKALGLWRGPALTGVDSRVVAAGARRLEERRLSATEGRIRLDLALGRHADLVDELSVLVAEHPLREHLHAHLMLALYRSGRQAEALEAYRRLRAALVEELGIEPGNELRQLEKAILLGSDDDLRTILPARPAPPPAPAPPAPHQLPSDIADFVGRDRTVRRMCQVLTGEIPTGHRAVAITAVVGPAGAGKTALAIHVAHRSAGAYPDGQLYANLAGTSRAPADPSEILIRFLRALGVPGQSIPDGLDERAELYRSMVADRRLLVVLDDATETQVRPLLPGSVSCRVLVTSRSRLPALPGVRRVDLGVLSEPDATALLARIVGAERVRAEPAAAAGIVRLCGRLPLAVRIAGARLTARPHWRLSRLLARLDDETRRLDELEHGEFGIRASLTLSYDALPPMGRRLLRRLVLVDAARAGAWVAAALLDTDPREAEELLERLVEAQLLEPFGDRYLVPELVQVFARERAGHAESPAQIEAARRRFFGALLALAETAHRREYGGDYTVVHGAAERYRLPPAMTDKLLADPLGWLDTERDTLVAAVRQTAALRWDEYCWDLALTAVTLFEARSLFGRWRECAETGLACTSCAGNRRGQAAMRYSAGALSLVERRFTEARGLLVEALRGFEECADNHGRALVLRNLAHLDRLADEPDRARERYAEALDGLRGAGDLVGQAHVLCNLAAIHLDAGDSARARSMLDEALAICRTAGSRRVEAQVLARLGELYLDQGEPDRAAEAFGWVLRLVHHRGDRIGEAYSLVGLGHAKHLQGHHDQASSCLSEALHLSRQLGERLVEGRALHALGELDVSRKRWDLAVSRFSEAVEIFGAIPAVQWQARALSSLATAYAAMEDQPTDIHRSWTRWSESRSESAKS